MISEFVIYPAENVEAGNKFSRRGGAAASVWGRTLTRGGNTGSHDILTRAARRGNGVTSSAKKIWRIRNLRAEFAASEQKLFPTTARLQPC